MPQNPNLFPSDYPDLCPRTELQEEDCCDEMRRLIRTLRHQHLLAARRAGQSIAELQNQSLIDECCTIVLSPDITNPATPLPIPQPPQPPPPSPGTKAVYFGGGEFQGIHGQVEKFIFDTLVTSVLDFSITPRMRHASASSSRSGYWLGGQLNFNTWDGTNTTAIDGINFSGETQRTVSNALTTAYFYSRSAFSETKAYVVGRNPAGVTQHDRFTFSTETAAAAGTMPSVTQGTNGGQSSAKAIFAGGVSNNAAIDGIPFSTETPAAIAATLSVPRSRGACLSADRKFYIAGGYTSGNTAVRSIDAFVFATETCSVIGAQLAVSTDDISGWAGSGSWGAIAGGAAQTPARKLQKLRFDAETCEQLNATLYRGGRYPEPVGKP